MEIEFVTATVSAAPKTGGARIVFEGERHEVPLAQAIAASRFTGGKGQTLDLIAPVGVDKGAGGGVGARA